MTFGSDNLRQVACLGAAGFIGTALILAAASPIHAQPNQKPVTVIAHKEAPTERVLYGDLALTTSEGRSILYHRVGAAVNDVCPDVDSDGFTYDVQGCKDFAWNGARPQISRAIRDAKSGASLAMAIEIVAVPTK